MTILIAPTRLWLLNPENVLGSQINLPMPQTAMDFTIPTFILNTSAVNLYFYTSLSRLGALATILAPAFCDLSRKMPRSFALSFFVLLPLVEISSIAFPPSCWPLLSSPLTPNHLLLSSQPIASHIPS